MSLKRNDFLDISDEEDGKPGSDDNDVDDSRLSKLGRRSVKRRKLDTAESDLESHESDATVEHNEFEDSESYSKNEATSPPAKPAPSSLLKTPKIKSLAASQLKTRKTGVIYLSRIPPFMKPATLRHLFSPYGTLNRIFLTPEPTPMYNKRVRSGGNKKRSYLDGWVEFASKKKAKICAETLNGNTIGGRKGSWYHDDIWNLKYLKRFKWDDLMEQVRHEEQVREGRLRAAIQQEARERNLFLENVERAKGEKGMEAKRAKKKVGVEEGGKDPEEEVQEKTRRERTFRQNKVKERDKDLASYDQREEVKRVLSKIF